MNYEESQKQREERLNLVRETFKEEIHNLSSQFVKRHPDTVNGYETAAQNEAVSLLTFCEIFAKAKELDFQPAAKMVKDRNIYPGLKHL